MTSSSELKLLSSVDELLAAKPKVIVEAAGQQAVRDYYEKLVASNAEIIVMSTGALLSLNADEPKVHFPAGAIGGLRRHRSSSQRRHRRSNLDVTQKPQSTKQNKHRRSNHL